MEREKGEANNSIHLLKWVIFTLLMSFVWLKAFMYFPASLSDTMRIDYKQISGQNDYSPITYLGYISAFLADNGLRFLNILIQSGFLTVLSLVWLGGKFFQEKKYTYILSSSVFILFFAFLGYVAPLYKDIISNIPIHFIKFNSATNLLFFIAFCISFWRKNYLTITINSFLIISLLKLSYLVYLFSDQINYNYISDVFYRIAFAFYTNLLIVLGSRKIIELNAKKIKILPHLNILGYFIALNIFLIEMHTEYTEFGCKRGGCISLFFNLGEIFFRIFSPLDLYKLFSFNSALFSWFILFWIFRKEESKNKLKIICLLEFLLIIAYLYFNHNSFILGNIILSFLMTLPFILLFLLINFLRSRQIK